MSTTYHSLASGNFTQDWSNAGLITTTDNWSMVPSIMGYSGVAESVPVGADPSTLTGSVMGAVDIVPDQVNPNLFNVGGVAEFAIADPTAALQGSGAANAPSLVLYLDAAGRENVHVSFSVRDIESTPDDALQQLAVQYRVGPSGAWTNVAGGYVADATTGGAATLVTLVAVTLPAAANNQGQVEVRILTTNAPGNDEWIGIEDITVSSVALAGGAETTAPMLVGSAPSDNASSVAVSSSIVLTFDEAVQAGTGDIVVSDGAGDTRTITLGTSVPDGTVTFNGTQVTIDLAGNLNGVTHYASPLRPAS